MMRQGLKDWNIVEVNKQYYDLFLYIRYPYGLFMY